MARSPEPVTAPDPRPSVAGAIADGWQRVFGATTMAIGLLVVTLLVALPYAALERWPDAAGGRPERDTGLEAFEHLFSHEIVAFAATPDLLADVVAADPRTWGLVASAVLYLIVWMFLSGGAIDRLARDRPLRAAAFFAACGEYFFRFLRLAVPLLFGYALLMHLGMPLFFRVLPSEAAHIVLFALMMAGALIADFAKVRIVVEDRRSALGALAASWRFVWRRPFAVAALYILNLATLTLLIIAVTYPTTAAPMWLIAPVVILLRTWVQLAFIASEISFFQRSLAHAGYTASPPYEWPESASVEAIRNLTRRKERDS
jgi:hypothetical protein